MFEASGIEVNRANERGDTPLYFGAWNGHRAIVKTLLACKDIDVSQATNKSETPLHLAVSKNDLEIALALLRRDNAHKKNKFPQPRETLITGTPEYAQGGLLYTAAGSQRT